MAKRKRMKTYKAEFHRVGSIEIKRYTNGTYSFYSEEYKGHKNINSELAQQIIALKPLINEKQ